VVPGQFPAEVTPLVVPVGRKVDARENGIFMPLVAPCDVVQNNQSVGRFQSLSTGKNADIDAPCEGVVFSVMTAGPAAQDDYLVEVVDDIRLCTRFS
jgi:predicted deacylase